MNFYNLEVFCLCVEKRNYTEVAHTLSISQPAVSLHIKTLEEYFGVQLFERKGKKLYLTEPGEAVYQYATTHLQGLELLKGELSRFQNGTAGKIVIGASHLGRYQLPITLAKFKQKNNFADIQLVIDDRDTIYKKIADGSIDFAYIVSVGENLDFITETVRWEPQILICAPDHPLAKKELIEKDELAEYPMIAGVRKRHKMRSIEEFLKEAGVADLDVVIELGDIEGIKKGVQSGLGIGFMYQIAVEDELKLGLVKEVKIKDLELFSRIDIAYQKDKKLSPITRNLINELKLDKGL